MGTGRWRDVRLTQPKVRGGWLLRVSAGRELLRGERKMMGAGPGGRLGGAETWRPWVSCRETGVVGGEERVRRACR